MKHVNGKPGTIRRWRKITEGSSSEMQNKKRSSDIASCRSYTTRTADIQETRFPSGGLLLFFR
ncbi:hypothetical protein H5410_057649 [Solanum commersonii]|uniref:Uncharacterized protein n=1 Tax=Solanum commersonii TaxID=4109 RepID=A0A9J5WNG7_SOLCO|nr:hypothetical protein H5410_057649 [Solanum commersonii]